MTDAPSPDGAVPASSSPLVGGGLAAVLGDAHGWGFLGPGPVERHVDHARAMGTLLDVAVWSGARVVDLGAGGGVPGLVLALEHPTTEWILVESGQRRASFLIEAIERLGLASRVRVYADRAEVAGREAALRARCDIVTARSFAAPTVTSECSAPLVRVGGVVLVSEPPELDTARWPVGPMAELGLRTTFEERGGFHFSVHEKVGTCPDLYPRRIGVPGKRPRF